MVLSWNKGSERSSEDAEQALELSGLRAFEDAFATIGVGFWIYSEKTNKFVSSAGLNEIYRKAFSIMTHVEALQRALFGDEDVDAEIKKDWNSLLGDGRMFDHEHEITRMDGGKFWVRSLISAAMADDGSVDRLFGLVIDIDHRRRHESASKAAVNAAETASRHKSDFVATMSHEIRTPLNGMLGMAQMLMMTELNENQKSCVDTINASGQALMGILNDSLDISKIEAGEIEIEPRPFSVEGLVGEVIANASGVAAQKGVETGCAVDPAIGAERIGDADRIRQVLTNLVFNGLKFTSSGSVTVKASPCGAGRVRFVVADTGPGVSAEDAGRIFEKFKHAKGESGERRGAGLGLAISKQLVELMGGRIGVESEPGAGSRFWFELPLEGGEGASAGAEAPTPPPMADDGGVRILVAEDDPINQQVFKAALEIGDYNIDFAENGLEAIEKLKTTRYNLVLMDINMPVMSGEEAIVQIRASEEPWRDVPIIVVTALTNRDSRRYYCSLGATDYLPKPIDVALLLKKTANLLEAVSASA